MAQMRKMACVTEIQSSADKFYDAFKNRMQLMPKMASQQIKDVQLVQGNWNSVGAVRHWTFIAGGKCQSIKEITESADDKNKTLVFKLVEGDMMKSYRNWKTTINVSPMPKGKGSLVKWTMEFEKQNESVPDPVIFADIYFDWTKNVDAYLLNTKLCTSN